MSKTGRRTFLGTILGAAMAAVARPLLASVPKVTAAESFDQRLARTMRQVAEEQDRALLYDYWTRPIIHIESGPGDRVTVWQTWIPSA